MTKIRACTPDDATAVAALLGELGYVLSATQAAEHLRHLCSTGSDPIFLAVSDAQVLGLAASHCCRMLQYEKPVMRITALVVARLARRRGVGRLLMAHTERLAAAAGCEVVELTSAMDRAEAHAFYRGIGYQANSLRFRRLLIRE
jgi:GNAT superfamily N-acetyltransferase